VHLLCLRTVKIHSDTQLIALANHYSDISTLENILHYFISDQSNMVLQTKFVLKLI
jgi:hypothetical protein